MGSKSINKVIEKFSLDCDWSNVVNLIEFKVCGSTCMTFRNSFLIIIRGRVITFMGVLRGSLRWTFSAFHCGRTPGVPEGR